MDMSECVTDVLLGADHRERKIIGSKSGGQAYLVRVDGHSGRQSQDGDSVEASCVGDRGGGEVVVGSRRVTD